MRTHHPWMDDWPRPRASAVRRRSPSANLLSGSPPGPSEQVAGVGVAAIGRGSAEDDDDQVVAAGVAAGDQAGFGRHWWSRSSRLAVPLDFEESVRVRPDHVPRPSWSRRRAKPPAEVSPRPWRRSGPSGRPGRVWPGLEVLERWPAAGRPWGLTKWPSRRPSSAATRFISPTKRVMGSAASIGPVAGGDSAVEVLGERLGRVVARGEQQAVGATRGNRDLSRRP